MPRNVPMKISTLIEDAPSEQNKVVSRLGTSLVAFFSIKSSRSIEHLIMLLQPDYFKLKTYQTTDFNSIKHHSNVSTKMNVATAQKEHMPKKRKQFN